MSTATGERFASEQVVRGFLHPEAPTAVDGGVLFSDVASGGIYRYAFDGRVETLEPHRRGIGGLCLHATGGLVVTGRNVALKADGRTGAVLLEPGKRGETFSDLCADRLGRLYVGGLFYDRLGTEEVSEAGRLYRIELDGTVAQVGEKTSLPNGVAFSPDRRFLYHSDTIAGVVWRYDVNEAGDLSARSAWLDAGEEWPDGLAVAADGSVWVAMARGGRVAGWSPEGRHLGEVRLDVPMATSVCFAGPDFAQLYITAGGPEGDDRGGGLHVADVRRSGDPADPARVRVGDEPAESPIHRKGTS